ncbi:MAG: glycosyltransferase family 39 protein, partial [Candidatus Margulisbacteria bacterium]|nr:glycosyltransferase family 39 protein [Candidatus Margulisiibacteriota bacterium]
MSRNTIIFLTIAALVRLLLANLFPMTADESYYWLWSKHLSLSYVDHPPMVAYINYLMTFGRENLFALRLGCVIITLLASILIYFLAKKIFDEKVAFWSAVLFQIIPHFVVVWLTMFVELPLALLWTASLLILAGIVRQPKAESRTQNIGSWLLLGLTLGFGYLSKYTMFLFWPCLAIYFLIVPEQRFWLRRKEPYLCALLSAFCFLPVLFWNYHHAWVSFTFHSGKASAEAWGVNVLPFIGDQLIHFTPFLLFALYNVYRYALKKDNGTRLLFSFSAPVLLLFLLLSAKVKIWAHWTEVGYIGALPLTVAYLIENGKSLKKFITWISIFSGLVLAILLFISPAILLHQSDYRQNYTLSEKLPSDLKIFARTNVSASLLEFYTKR